MILEKSRSAVEIRREENKNAYFTKCLTARKGEVNAPFLLKQEAPPAEGASALTAGHVQT